MALHKYPVNESNNIGLGQAGSILETGTTAVSGKEIVAITFLEDSVFSVLTPESGTNLYIGNSNNNGDYKGAIGFTTGNTNNVRSAIAAKQTHTSANRQGLAFLVHPDTTVGTFNEALVLNHDSSATFGAGVDVTGTLTATTLAGTLSTAAQTNITSVGTLTSFRSTGIDDNADATAITITSAENVGINSTSPQTKFVVQHTDGQNGIEFSMGATESYIQSYNRNTNDYSDLSIAAETLRFRTNDNTERMRILSNGNILTGRTTDFGSGFKLSIDHSSTVRGQVITSDATANKTAILFHDKNSGDSGSITYDGSSTAYNTSSDYRLKENIESLKNGLEKVKKLNPVQFSWIKSKKTSEGFIAHEVQDICKEAVSGEKDGEVMQGMDYGRITPLLVKAIQEQQTIIEDLKTRIETLEK